MTMTAADINAKYERASRRPWEASYGMVRVTPHSWYVGDAWVGVILIETEDGIVLLDSGIAGQMWLIFESVRKLGYDPEKDIRLCLLSHAHPDHCSGAALLRAYARPVLYMSPYERDWPHDPERYADLPPEVDMVVPFDADRYYDYETPIGHGGFSFTVLHTPGHTPGTSSFFYEDRNADGTVYRVGMHGGMGLNTLFDGCFGSREEALRVRGIYRRSMESLLGLPVDITITNHAGNIEMSRRMPEDRADYRPFVDPSYWRRHLEKKLLALDALEKESVFRP